MLSTCLQNATTFHGFGIAKRYLAADSQQDSSDGSAATIGLRGTFLAGMFAGEAAVLLSVCLAALLSSYPAGRQWLLAVTPVPPQTHGPLLAQQLHACIDTPAGQLHRQPGTPRARLPTY